MPIRFAINRTCAPHLPLDAFVGLANAAGVDAVEIRNDVPGREFMNGTPVADLRARLDDAGLGVASVNALQRFNDWTAEREAEARALVAHAAGLGAPGLVMCPVIDEAHGWSDAELAAKLREALRGLRPILADHGVTGYLEPLGMRGSTLTRQARAVEAVSDVDVWTDFALCYDTFQSFRCGDDQVFPEHVGLVHVSCISRHDLVPGELTEPDRDSTTIRFESRDALFFTAAMAELAPETEVIVQNAGSDPARQQSQIEDAIAQEAAAIVLTTADANLAAGGLAAAEAAGIPVVLYDHDAVGGGKADPHVVFDSLSVRRAQGEQVAQLIEAMEGSPVRVGRVKGNQGKYGITQHEAGQDEFLQPLIGAGKVEVVCEQYTQDWDPVLARASPRTAPRARAARWTSSSA